MLISSTAPIGGNGLMVGTTGGGGVGGAFFGVEHPATSARVATGANWQKRRNAARDGKL
jgi:hypothetical protein